MAHKVRVYKVDDGDWIAARTEKQALRQQAQESSEPLFLNNAVRVLSDAELDTNCVQDETFGDDEPVTFRTALARLAAAGAKFPCVLAIAE